MPQLIKQHDRPDRGRGFTLVELLLVVVILSIIGTLAVPMMGNPESDRLRAAARLLEADIGFAQVESMSHTDDLRLLVLDDESAAQGYMIATAGDEETPITNPINHQPYKIVFGQGRARDCAGVTLVDYDLDADNVLKFGAFGQLDQATDATITLGLGNHRLTLTVGHTSGEVSVGEIFTP